MEYISSDRRGGQGNRMRVFSLSRAGRDCRIAWVGAFQAVDSVVQPYCSNDWHTYHILIKHHCLHQSGLCNALPIVLDVKMPGVHCLALQRLLCETEVGIGGGGSQWKRQDPRGWSEFWPWISAAGIFASDSFYWSPERR